MSDQKVCPTCGTEYPLSERFCPRDGTALRATNAQGDLLGSIIAERYHILKKLGEGGMGQVYLAEHVKMGRKAALKVMNPGMNQDADAIARFNREAANASRLNHPNICAIYDFGETQDGLIYLAMEFIEGQSLTSLIEKAGALTPARAASIIHQAADALQVAHDVGIVHRDLKPDNIMIAKGRDGSDNAKVVDFGIAKASSSDAQKVTKTGLVVGTPEYMSPEQLAGDKLDGRSDIYSLGLVAFNCLTGKLPFPSNSAQEAMIMRLTDQPKTLADMKPDVAWPDALQAVMDRALARDAAERYQSAAEFGRDMARAVEGMPSTIAAEAGTMVIGVDAVAAATSAKTAAAPAMPKTRVAGPSDRGAAAAPAAPAAPPARKSGLPMPAIAAAAVILLGGGGYAAMQMMGGGGATQSDSTSQTQGPTGATQPQTTPSGAGGSSGTPQTNQPTVTPMRAAGPGTNPAPNAGRTGGGGGASTTPTERPISEIVAEMSGLSERSDLAAVAAGALATIDGALPRASGTDRGDLLLYKAIFLDARDRRQEACVAASLATAAGVSGRNKAILQGVNGMCP